MNLGPDLKETQILAVLPENKLSDTTEACKADMYSSDESGFYDLRENCISLEKRFYSNKTFAMIVESMQR